MAVTEKMNIDERFKFLRNMKAQYLDADRQTKKSLLTMMQDSAGQHRKHLIARMNGPGPQRKTRKRQRCRTYGVLVQREMEFRPMPLR